MAVGLLTTFKSVRYLQRLTMSKTTSISNLLCSGKTESPKLYKTAFQRKKIRKPSLAS